MNTLNVKIEICGEWHQVGQLRYKNWEDAIFAYDKNYLDDSNSQAISVGLPLQQESFDAQTTKNYFDGLLPEGFTRNAIAATLPYNSQDYISILKKLGSECLGALAFIEDEQQMPSPTYNHITKAEVKKLANEGVKKSAEYVIASHLSLAGASGKVGLYYDKKNNTWYQPMGTAPSTHIVKQSNVNYARIVINEQLCMKTAELIGLNVPNSFILNTGSNNDDDLLFVTERYDRKDSSNCKKIGKLNAPFRLHQEDFAQAMNISNDKYDPNKTYFEQMGQIAKNNCSDPIKAISDIFDISIFNWLIGNTDGHIKNFSMLYDETLQHRMVAPAYDIVSIYCINEKSFDSGEALFAFAVDGHNKLKDISLDAFHNAANNMGVNENIAQKSFDKISNKFESALKQASKILVDEGYTDAKNFANTILKENAL